MIKGCTCRFNTDNMADKKQWQCPIEDFKAEWCCFQKHAVKYEIFTIWQGKYFFMATRKSEMVTQKYFWSLSNLAFSMTWSTALGDPNSQSRPLTSVEKPLLCYVSDQAYLYIVSPWFSHKQIKRSIKQLKFESTL